MLFTVLYDNEQRTVFLRKRTEKDIWRNFYDFKLTEFLEEDSFLLAQKKRTCYNKVHKLTHQTLQVCFIKEVVRKSRVDLSGFRPYNLNQLDSLPLSALHQRYIDDNLGFLKKSI